MAIKILNDQSITGTLSVVKSTSLPLLNIFNNSNGSGATIKFSDLANTQAQNGSFTYVHTDTQSYGSGNAFILTGTEASMTILADGKLMYKEGIYSKPTTGTGAGTRKDSNWDSAYNNKVTAISDSGTSTTTITLTQQDGGTLSTSFSNPQGTITSSGSITGYSGSLIRTDNRIIAPNEYTAGRLNFGFTSWGNNNSSPYADFLHMSSYTDSSGGSPNLLMLKKSGIGMRIWQQSWNSATAYANYEDVYTTADPVVKVVGTPVNNQLAVWTNGNEIEGESELTYDGATLRVGGTGNTSTFLDVVGTNTAGAPATAAAVRIYGYEGRGEGIFYYDSTYASSEWYSGLPYAGGDTYQVGYDASGNQAQYAANAAMSISSGKNTTFSGTVGVGTAAPTGTYQLSVDGHAKISAEKYYYVAGSGAGVGSDASGNLILRQNSTNLMTTSGSNATFAGNVIIGSVDSITTGLNIGNASPTIQLFDTTNDSKLLIYTQDSSSVIGTYSNHTLNFFTNSTQALEINTSQNAIFAGNVNTSGSIRVANGTDQGSQLCLFADSNGHTSLAGFDFEINTGGNNSRSRSFFINSSGAATFTGLVSGITPTNPTNFAIKSYVDAHDGGAGVYLPLSGGTMLGDIVMADELLNFATGGNVILPQFIGPRNNTDLNSRTWTTQGAWSYTTFDNGTTNQPSAGLHNANGLLTLNTHSGAYFHQLAMTTNTGKLWHRVKNGGGYGSWGQIWQQSDFANNSTNWNTSYDNMVTGVTVTGTTTKTITLTQQDGGTVSNTFTAGVVQEVASGNTNTITIGGNTANPTVAANTAAVNASSANLATGSQIQTAINTAIGSIPSGLSFEGNWNASTDSPSLAGSTPSNGIFYIVSVAGSTNLSGITDWAIGDWAVYVSNGAGTDAWQKVDNSSTLSGLGSAGKVTFWSSDSNVSFNNNFTYDGTTLISPQIAVGDGTDGEFFSDTPGRTAFRNGDFYIQANVTNSYNYATNQYIGNASGDNIYFRSNPLTGTNWGITIGGAANFDSTLIIGSIANATSDLDKFLVSDSGTVKYRTGAQLRSDIGAGTGNGTVTGSGASGRVALWSSSNNISEDVDLRFDSTYNTLYSPGLLTANTRVNSSQHYPTGHYTPGETVWEIDPTWNTKQLQEYFNSSNVSWSTNSIAQDAPGGYAIYINGATSVGGVYNSGFPYIPVDNDGVYYMECYIKNVGTNGHYMGSNEFNATFGSTGGNPGSFGYWVMSNTNPGTNWTKVSGYIGGFDSSQVGKFELATKYWTPQALFNYTNSSGTRACYISGWKAVRVDAPGNRYFDDNVNIGSNALPTARLQISQTGSGTSNTIITQDAARKIFIGRDSIKCTDLSNNAAMLYVQQNGGNVTFGNDATVGGALSVTGVSNLTAPVVISTNDSTLTIKDAGTNATQIVASAGDELYIGSNNTYQIQMTPQGNVNAESNWTFSNNVTLTGNLLGNTSNTTELGVYSTNAIKRIRMVQGGELHFGDTTTAAPLGITEGDWNSFSDADRLSIYGRTSIKFYAGAINKTLAATLGSTGLILNTITNATADPDKFLCASSGGTVGYRTGSQVRSDIGAAPVTATATSLYDLLPSGRFTTTYAFTSTAGTYAEVMEGNDVITLAGTYSVQMYVNDYAVGGTQYREYYSGVMSWNAPDNTNDDGLGAISEIVLHRAGHAANQGMTYLRTRESGSSETNKLKLEIMGNRTYTGASNVVFKFVRLI